MKTFLPKLHRTLSYGLILAVALPSVSALAAPNQQATPAQQSQGTAGSPPQAQTPATGQSGATSEPGSTQGSTSKIPQNEPVGAAAAPVLNPAGNPGSRPAGAAIAPAKQRRSRSFAIRVALLIGAAVAVGAVIAASLSTSSRSK